MSILNCRDCQHYKVTWDEKKPHGCQAFNFKSAKLPSVVVESSSGVACEGFLPKENLKKKVSVEYGTSRFDRRI